MFSDFLLSEFHTIKNNPKKLTDFKEQSNKKVWWKCTINPLHEWEAYIANRSKGTGCPMCSGRVIDSTNNLGVSFPNIAAEWHPVKNGTLTAKDVVAGSNKKVWWKCSKNSLHEWETAPNSRKKGHGCPICIGNTTFGGNTVEGKFPELVMEWYKDKNGLLKPSDVCPKSDKKVWWICPDKKHSYHSKIGNRTDGTSCPICTNRKTILENSLTTLFPKIAAEWHPTKNKVAPSEIIPNSSLRIWWKCSKEHEWIATPTNRTRFNNMCPSCSGRLASADNNLLVAHPDIAAEWHPIKNKDAKPENFTPSSHSKVWWQCPKYKTHEYDAIIANRTICNKSSCPYCNQSKMEKATHNLLKELKVDFVSQKKFPDLKYKNNQLSYDFYLDKYKAVIECDGRQHFEEVTEYFHHNKSLHNQKLRDVVKNAYAAREGFAILRFAFTEIEYIPKLIETFIARLERGERPISFVGAPFRHPPSL